MTPPEIDKEELRAAMKAAIKEELKAAEMADPKERKELMKQAAKEVYRENIAAFGWWSVKTLGAMVLVVLVYAFAKVQGWLR